MGRGEYDTKGCSTFHIPAAHVHLIATMPRDARVPVDMHAKGARLKRRATTSAGGIGSSEITAAQSSSYIIDRLRRWDREVGTAACVGQPRGPTASPRHHVTHQKQRQAGLTGMSTPHIQTG